MAQTDDGGQWKANGYVVKYGLDLYNNYTWFLTDPVNGDQFHQHDDRTYGGGGVSRTIQGSLFGRPSETVFGVQSRYDDITLALTNTVQRQFLSNTLLDHVSEGNAGIYVENTVQWTDWLRPPQAGAAIIMRRRWIRSCNRRTRAATKSRSAAQNCASSSGRSTKPNSSSASAWAITAMTRAA